MKNQTLLQPPQTPNGNQTKNKKTFIFHQQPRTKLLNDQKTSFSIKKSLKRSTFTSFCNKNNIKNQPLEKTDDGQRQRTLERE